MGQFTLDSYRTDSNMNKFLILSACLALATAAPGGHLLGAGLAGGIVPAGYAGLAGGAVVGTAVAPALPVPAAPTPIPPPAANYGPAPADAVTTYAVDAPVRTHTKITPRLHRIEPELQVNQVPYDVPVA